MDIGEAKFNLFNISEGKHLRRGVHIVEYGAVDADGGIGCGILLDERCIDGLIGILHEDLVAVKGFPTGLTLPEDAQSGIAALDGAIEVVPVVEDAELEIRSGIALLAS